MQPARILPSYTLYGYLVAVYGEVMALTGERTLGHLSRVATGVLLRTLLAAAVVLAPALQCPAAERDPAAANPAPAQHTPASAAVHTAPAGLSVTTTPSAADNDHQCTLLPAGAALAVTAADTLHGSGALPAAVAFGAAALWALWAHSTRGPPRRAAIWFLSSGRDRLQHFCVMRR